jgi:SAM domain (Sterile alpha motif)/Adenylate and Guanylate cyclase catalytic domain
MDVATWLRGLGLERYEAAFRDNEIDWEVLPKLTSEDLKDLGVVLGGHRRKLLDAIAALRDQPEATAERASAVSIAERRQLTVMFCDLVGSTALSARLDPEDLRELIGVYHAATAEVIGRFNGFVAKYMGDGVLAYFGYPQAHEDDAERAVQAGLAVAAATRQLQTSELLQDRSCHRPHGGRGSDRIRFSPRADGGRRDAEPRRAIASAGRAQHCCHC